jgi:hypothetical protein
MKFLILLGLIFSLGCLAQSGPRIPKGHAVENPDFYLGGFDGVWSGNLKTIKGQEYPFIGEAGYEISMKLDIQGNRVQVWISPAAGQDLKEIYPGRFRISKHKTNAVIYSINSESEKYNEHDKGEWVETLNLTLTLKDNSSLYVYHVRAVNNFLLDPELHSENSAGRFFFSGSGELKKVEE